MEAAWKLTWDYNYPNGLHQNDWNQTLQTKLNQISAQIHKACMYSGANQINIHSNLVRLLETLEFCKNTDDGMFIGKYKVIVDDNTPTDIMYVYLSNLTIEPIEGFEDNTNIWISTESPKLEEYKQKTWLNIHTITPDRIVGEVKILNYTL